MAKRYKISAIGIALATLIVLPVLLSGEAASLSAPLTLLLPLAAILTLLAALSHETAPSDLLTLLIFLGLGLGFMIVPGKIGHLSLGGVFIVLILLLIRQKSRSRFSELWGVGLYGFALVMLIASLVSSPSTGRILLLLTYAVLLPTCPLHGASIVTFSRLGGILPNFFALFLPALGLKGVLGILAELPPQLMGIVSIFALIGALYGGVRALVQTHIRPRLAYAGLTFWSILWWYLAGTGIGTAPAILYFCAIALTMQGLFLSGQVLETRHGELHLNQLGGVARVMPRFGILLSLLVAAAMGLPLFGSFTALFAMATSPEITLSWGVAVVLLAWLLASWHFPLFMQRILLGPAKPGRIYRDLVPSETLSLTLIVAMIVILGIAPDALFGPEFSLQQSLVVHDAKPR